MSTTGTQVFALTMDLIDASVGGVADISDTQDYKNRMVSIINMLSFELYPYSGNYAAAGGARPMPVFIAGLADNVGVDDGLARGIMPHGAASLLLVAEGETALANAHQQLYQEKIARLKNFPAESEDIENLYGGIEHLAVVN